MSYIPGVNKEHRPILCKNLKELEEFLKILTGLNFTTVGKDTPNTLFEQIKNSYPNEGNYLLTLVFNKNKTSITRKVGFTPNDALNIVITSQIFQYAISPEKFLSEFGFIKNPNLT